MKRLFWLFLVVFAMACSSSSSEKDAAPGQDTASDVAGEEVGADQSGLDVVEDTGVDSYEDQLPELTDTVEDGQDVEPDGDTTEPDDVTDVEIVDPNTETLCAELPPAANGTCTVTPGSAAVLIKGVILAPTGTLRGGEVLVDPNGLIVCVDCTCADHPDAEGATTVVCPNGVVTPGLINAHDHITFTQNFPGDWGTERYEHRHDWRKGIRGHTKISVPGGASTDQVIWGELRQVLGGATSLAGSGSAKGFLRNLDKNDQEGLGSNPLDYDTFPLGDSDGTLLSSGCGYPGIISKNVLQNDCYFPHVSEGIDKEARNEFVCLSSDSNGGVDVTEPNSTFVHVVGLKAIDGAEMASNGTAMVWSPRSNVSLYGNTAPVTMYKHQGVLIALGTDWTASGSVNMLREYACADLLNKTYYDSTFSDREIWAMGTQNAAQALAIDDLVGSLSVGLVADIAIFDEADAVNPYQAIFHANVGDVWLVLRGGLPLFGDSSIVPGLPGGDVGCEVMQQDVCGAQKSVCSQREVSKTLSQLQSSNTSAYPLFFCDVPSNEPSCVPMRPGEYTGTATDVDWDGDGVNNDLDNCPRVFNPIRPLDEGKQADADNDGIGDNCDPCPLDANTTQCTVPDPDDKDGDGIPNAQDNCPEDSNGDQKDSDSDGVGDLCDNCPDVPNPGNSACPATIYQVKSGTVAKGSLAKVSGVVTAVSGTRIFIQVPLADHNPTDQYNYSGLFLFIPSSNPNSLTIPAPGDVVEVAGRVSDYFGQIQMDNITTMTKQGQAPVPPALSVTLEEVATGGTLATKLEGVLVETPLSTVTALNPDPGPGDSAPTNEFVLDGKLNVNDYLYLTTPFPIVGESLQVTGVLRYSNNMTKLEPRSDADLIRSLALKSFGPSPAYIALESGPGFTSPLLTITLTSEAPAGGTVVTLSSNNTDVLTVPAQVTVPAGEASVALSVTPVEASQNPVTVTASFDGISKTAQVYVISDTTPRIPVAIEPEEATVMTGATQQFTVQLNLPAPAAGVVVTLSATAGTVPASVTIPAEALSAQFEFTAPGTEATVTITAEANGTSVEASVTVIDTPMLGLVISEVFYDPASSDDGLEWVEIYNGTGQAIDLSNYAIGSGGTSWVITTLQLSGSIPAGGCFVVGGPTSAAGNYNPTYDQAADFNPDIQNSGDTADGVALFNLKASQLNESSLPIDSVIYGGSNASGLKNSEGQASAPDVGDASSGSSIQRTAAGWKIQPAPTPNDCTALFQ